MIHLVTTSIRSYSAADKHWGEMKISVALCTYNGEKYISEQIKSILNQTLEVDEIVICDDNSIDKTKEILTKFASENSCTKLVFNKKNLGFVKNFEKAISLCTGDFIFLSDQDDIWQNNKVERLTEASNKNPKYSFIFSDADLINEKENDLDNSLFNSVGFNKKLQKRFIEGNHKDILIQQNYITGATLAFRGEIKESIIPFSNNFYHDHWIGLLMSFLDYPGIFITDKLLKYRIHSNQVISVSTEDKLTHSIQNVKIMSGNHSSNFTNRINQLNDIKTRLINLQKLTPENEILLDELIYYFSARNRMYNINKSDRFKLILKLYRNGYYRKYATSNLIAIKDFVQKILL